MKLKFNKLMDLQLTAMTILFSSCVNSISEDIPEPGEIPIKFSTDILCKTTRIADTNFETGDTIGLYVLVQPKLIDQERYLDNTKLTCSELSGLEPEKALYYPEGDDVLCEFISYYPFQENGIPSKNNSIDISIKTDQSTDEALSKSDFLIAINKDVSPTAKPVPLAFRHKLCKVEIVLNPLPGEDINTLLAQDPEIIFSGFHSKASYNFSTDQFNSFTESNSIAIHGNWEIKSGKLTGKSVNLLPEPLLAENHRIVINVDNRSYNCTFPDNYSLESGTQNTLTLNYSISGGLQAVKTNYNIIEWEDGITGDTTPKETATSINTSKLTFSNSNVYKVMNNGTQIAEICKEYLLAGNVEDKAIVAYPHSDGKPDLSRGIVIGFPETPDKSVGGSVSWSTENTLTYTPGKVVSVSYLYFTKEHNIVFSTPTTPLSVWIEEDLLVDIRGEEKLVYPIVKIATQHWMASNLQTTQYTDGNKITKKTSTLSETAAYYAPTNNSSKFYNAAAVNTGKLAPIGWTIPTETTWSKLKTYLRNDASLMKEGTWKKDSNNKLWPANNKSGFNGIPEGFFAVSQNGNTIGYANMNYLADYWGMKDTENVASSNSTLLYYEHNDITLNGGVSNKALSVRCIRK